MITKSVSCGVLAVASVFLGACGGSGASKPSKSSPGKVASRPSHKFVVTMTGRPESPSGAPNGVGVAVIAFHDSTHQICWRFAHLHGFSHPTYAHIHKGPAHQSGPIVLSLSTSGVLRHRGCVSTSPSLMAAIAKRPSSYYVNVHSRQYPTGAIRAQL